MSGKLAPFPWKLLDPLNPARCPRQRPEISRVQHRRRLDDPSPFAAATAIYPLRLIFVLFPTSILDLNGEEGELAMRMRDAYSIFEKEDRGGRRFGMDRRIFFLPGYAPERRSSQDRRSGEDRRIGTETENVANSRRNVDRYMEFVNTQRGLFFGVLLSLPFWGLIIFSILMKR